MGLLHKESYDLYVSFLSVTPGFSPAHKARTSPPLCLTLWQWELFLQLRWLQFLYHFSSTTSISPSSSPPPGFFSLKEKSVNLNFLLDRPHWETDTGLIRWYLFIFPAARLHKSCFPPPCPVFNTAWSWYFPMLIVSPGMFALRHCCGERQLIRR